jgi:hypothetical protein
MSSLSSFILFMVGWAIVLGGLVYGGFLLGLPPQGIAVGAIVLLGIGILAGVVVVRRRERPPHWHG